MATFTSDKYVSLAVASITAVILFVQLIQAARNLTRQPARVAIFAQLLFCFTRNVTILAQMSLTSINCYALTVFGFIVYSFWIVILDYVLLLRSRAFTSKPMVLAVATYVLFCCQLGIQWYMTSTIEIVSKNGEFCSFMADFSLANYTLMIRTITELMLLTPFILKAYECWRLLRGSNANEDAKKWMSMSINNMLVTAGIIFVELMASVVAQVPSLGIWITAVYAVVNCVEASLVLFLIDDLKKKLTQLSGSGNSTKQFSRRSGYDKEESQMSYR